MQRLQWHEPVAYRRAVARQWRGKNAWEPLKFAAGAFVVMLVLRFVAGLKPNPNQISWTATLILAAALALFLAFVLPWLLLLLPASIVILSEKGINNIAGKGASIQFWGWEKVAACEIRTVTLDGRQYRALIAYGANDQEIVRLGLPDKPDAAEIAALLREYDKPLRVSE